MDNFYIVIADVHGDADTLEQKLEECDRWIDDKRKSGFILDGQTVQYVFLGDYIDRMPHHERVLRLVKERVDTGAVALIGNHETMMIGSVEKTKVKFSDGKLEENFLLWNVNDGIRTCREMFGPKMTPENLLSFSIADYVEDIRNSWMYPFIKSMKTSYETELIYFSHAPQSSNVITEDTLTWGNRKDYSDPRGDLIFKVPGNKVMAVHGHMHMTDMKIYFPRIVNFVHGQMMRTVVLADCGCGSSRLGTLHPVILRERTVINGKNFLNQAGVVAIL